MKIPAFMKTIDGMAVNTKLCYEQTLWQLNTSIKDQEPTPPEILKFLNQYKSSSLHRHKAAIKAYLEYTNPNEKWPFNRRQFAGRRQDVPRYVPPEIVQKIWENADNNDDRMYVKTLFTLGCRISELRGMQPGDIGPDGVKMVTKGGSVKLKPTIQSFNEELVAYARGKEGRVFPESYTFYYLALKKMGAKVGYRDISPHMLRHARAVDLLRKGMSLAFVQQILGHVSINTTAIYLQITGGELKTELEKAEANGSW